MRIPFSLPLSPFLFLLTLFTCGCSTKKEEEGLDLNLRSVIPLEGERVKKSYQVTLLKVEKDDTIDYSYANAKGDIEFQFTLIQDSILVYFNQSFKKEKGSKRSFPTVSKFPFYSFHPKEKTIDGDDKIVFNKEFGVSQVVNSSWIYKLMFFSGAYSSNQSDNR